MQNLKNELSDWSVEIINKLEAVTGRTFSDDDIINILDYMVGFLDLGNPRYIDDMAEQIDIIIN